MIWEIVKKQSRIFIRDRLQLLLLIGLPILLIIILSVSLGGFISGDTIEIEANVGIIEHTNEEEQFEQFINELKQSEMPQEELGPLMDAVEHLAPVHILKNEVFPELDSMFHISELDPSEKEAALEGDYAVIIEIPEDYMYDLLRNVILDEGDIGTITLYEKHEIGSAAVKSVVESFKEQLSMSVLLAKNDIDPNVIKVNTEFGEQTAIGQKKPINSQEYYTVGMAVMNVLYIAVAISSFAFLEKQSQVFNRVILSNVSRWTYFTGIFVSSTIFSFIQLFIIYSFSWLVFGVKWSVLPFILVTLCVAMAVGGLATLLTAFSYRMNSEQVINFFGTILIAFLALVGGSFFPIGDLSNVIQTIGDFTPNGAAMSAYLGLLRGDQLLEIVRHLYYLIIFTLFVISIAIFSFPKRGQIS